MQTSQPSVFARDHTLFGVCEALGEDFRFNPTLLRVPFAVLLLVNPTAVVCTYLALGVLVFLTRWIAPNPRPAEAPAEVAAEPVVEAPVELAEAA
jgi:phage shock protein PspC (stress-responsive transcriptional regulator)